MTRMKQYCIFPDTKYKQDSLLLLMECYISLFHCTKVYLHLSFCVQLIKKTLNEDCGSKAGPLLKSGCYRSVYMLKCKMAFASFYTITVESFIFMNMQFHGFSKKTFLWTYIKMC